MIYSSVVRNLDFLVWFLPSNKEGGIEGLLHNRLQEFSNNDQQSGTRFKINSGDDTRPFLVLRWEPSSMKRKLVFKVQCSSSSCKLPSCRATQIYLSNDIVSFSKAKRAHSAGKHQGPITTKFVAPPPFISYSSRFTIHSCFFISSSSSCRRHGCETHIRVTTG